MPANPYALKSAADASCQRTAPPTALHAAATVYCLTDAGGRIVAADQMAYDLMAQNGESNDGHLKLIGELVSASELPEQYHRALVSGSPIQFGARLGPRARQTSVCSVVLTALRGEVEPFVLVRVDLCTATSALATLDPLTQLPDRRALSACTDGWRRSSDTTAPVFAVLFLDLDDFKAVNDRYGHAVGDAVLQTLATRWPSCVREGDLVARFGGDEFVLLIRNAASPDEVEPVIRRLREATALPIIVGELTLGIHATVGWSTPAGADWSIDQLIAAADRDMYARKGRVLR